MRRLIGLLLLATACHCDESDDDGMRVEDIEAHDQQRAQMTEEEAARQAPGAAFDFDKSGDLDPNEFVHS